MQAIAAFLRDDVNAHRLFQFDAVVVDEALGLIVAIGPFGDGGTHARFADLEQARETLLHLVLAELGDEFVEPALAQTIGAKLAANVAEHQLGRTAVGGDDAVNVTLRFEFALIAHRRKMQTLVESLARLPGAASRHRSADVTFMGDRATESE